jgi:hypothetical protein
MLRLRWRTSPKAGDGRRYKHINTGPGTAGKAVADSREVVCVWREGAAVGRRERQAFPVGES